MDERIYRELLKDYEGCTPQTTIQDLCRIYDIDAFAFFQWLTMNHVADEKFIEIRDTKEVERKKLSKNKEK